MTWLGILGTLVTLIGVALLAYCVMAVNSARRQGLSDDALRARMSSLVAVNMGALFLSAIGLMLVILDLLVL